MKWVLPLLGLAALVGGGIYVSSIYFENKELKKEKLVLETQIETFETNIELLEELLVSEREIRETAQQAQTELKQDVPDVDFNTSLPDSVQGVLDRFHGANSLQ